MASRRTHHTARRHLRGFGYFSRLGPAVVTGAADDDPSGIGTYSQVGASFGFGLLWLAPFTLPLAAAVQETAGRLGLTTGHGLATSIAATVPATGAVVRGGGGLRRQRLQHRRGPGVDGRGVQLLVPVPFAVIIVVVALT